MQDCSINGPTRKLHPYNSVSFFLFNRRVDNSREGEASVMGLHRQIRIPARPPLPFHLLTGLPQFGLQATRR